MYRLLRGLVRALATNRRQPRPQPLTGWVLPDEHLLIEHEQIRRHRTAVGVDPDIPVNKIPGLAISGGGIRSAVFSLGVLQSLADQGKLKQFSYISTVSGGTYLGAFYGSLFIPDELRQGAPNLPPASFIAAAQDAAERVRPKTLPQGAGAVTPIEYLRNNCNYLVPNGVDDVLQSIAFSGRNWFALQYVIGVAILTILLWLSWVEMLPWVRVLLPTPDDFPSLHLPTELAEGDIGWIVPAVLTFATAACLMSPLSRAYWLTQNLAQDMRRLFKALPWFSLLLVDVLAFGAIDMVRSHRVSDAWFYSPDWSAAEKSVVGFAWLVVMSQVLAITYFLLAWSYARRDKTTGKRWFHGAVSTVSRGSDSRPFVDRVRNALTNAYTTPARFGAYELLVGPAQLMLWLLAIALIDFAGSVAHVYILNHVSTVAVPKVLASALTASAAVWTAGRMLLAKGDAIESAVKRIPKFILATIAAVIATALTLLFWSTVAHIIVAELASYSSRAGWMPQWTHPWQQEAALTCVCVVMLLLAIVDGLCIQFLNLSTYQRLYSTRLTRAFLGASNRTRLNEPDQRDVTSLVSGDSISMGQYYHRESRAPVHLINTTINKTVDWNSSLVHRGARGLSLCVGPAGMTIGAMLGVLSCDWQAADDISTPASHVRDKTVTSGIWLESLTLGDWIAISGAAVSTGLGHMTRSGYSLLLGIANIRLGYWWDTLAPPFRDGAQSFKRTRIPLPTENEAPHFLRDRLFGTQCCLKNELLGQFDGPRARRWYLTDGGHFENTGAYELLRRELEFIVLLDNGADPKFIFDDVATLIRLVRVDFGIEITTSEDPVTQPDGFYIDFNYVALSFHEFLKRPECVGVRLKTEFPSGRKGQILLIKPRLTTLAPHDVWEYQHDMKTFPHETTANQFFNDVQWECHRALGESQARSLFMRKG